MDAHRLSSLFKVIYGRKFTDGFDDRLLLQKAAYILGEMNMSCGDYSFMWYEHGPYSSKLSYDIAAITDMKRNSEVIRYDKRGNEIISKVRKLFQPPSESDYSVTEWIEALSSIHYIMHYLLKSSNEDAVIERLQKCKPYLNKNDMNKKAYRAVNEFV